MEYKYNINLLIISKYYLCFLVALLNIFSINCSGLNCEKKIISESSKCVEKCPKDTYELGDYCYYQCPANKNMENDYTKLHKSCKCKKNYFLYKKEKNGKYEYDCVDICPSHFYDDETKKCVNDCGNKLTHIDRDNMGNEKQKRCSKKCLPSEFFKKDENACLDTCDYYLKENDTKICMEKCDDGYIYGRPDSEGGRECVLQCDQDDVIALVTIHPEEKKRKQCFRSKEVAQFYKYNDIYFENCKDTYEIFNIKTFQYKNNTSNEQICVDSCSKTDKQFVSLENECIDNCGQDFYYNKYCLKKCFRLNYNMDYSTISKIKNVINELIGDKNITDEDTIDFNQFPEEKECLERCPSGTLTDKDERKCYISTCPEGKFINSNHECIQGCESGVNEQNVILKSIKKIGETGPDENFHKVTKKFCLNSCPDNSPYYYNDKCYNVPCKEMNKYSTYDYPFICYDSCKEVKGYNDEKNFTCHKTQLRKLEDLQCESYYTMEGNQKKCLTREECFVTTRYRYKKDNECLNDCNGYIIENNLNQPYDCHGYLTDCIDSGYNTIVHVKENNKNLTYCRIGCDSETYYKIDKYYSKESNKEVHYCSTECPGDYPYKDSTSKKCLQNCPNYFLNDECVETCQSKEKYHFEDSKECVDNCKKNNKPFYIFDSDNTLTCHYSCDDTYKYITNYNNPGNAYICKASCDHYYENNNICQNSCNLTKSNTNNDKKICVHYCQKNQVAVKDNDHYYCDSKCPNGQKIKQEIIYTHEINTLMEVCVDNCGNDYKIYELNTTHTYCVQECPIEASYEYSNSCYEACPGTNEKPLYVDELDKKCNENACPSSTRQFYEKIGNIYICREKCPGDRFIIYGNVNTKGECVKVCPKEKNYIKDKNICVAPINSNKCPDNLYPVKIIEITTPEVYSIYNCSQNCGDKFTIYNKKECVDECSEGFYESPDRICYEGNCKLNTKYPFTTITKINSNDKKICAKKCDDSQPYYEKDKKICKASCDSEPKTIYDYDNECVDKCEKSNYIYYNEEDGKTKCVAECPESKKYNEVDKKCVETCEGTNKYVKENKCVTESEFSCDENKFEKTNNQTKEVECVLKCDDDQFYYEDQRKCLSDCDNQAHFKVQGTQKCITLEECPNPYYSYYSDGKDGQSYDSNMCLLKCPTDKPYIDNRKCVPNCPQTGNNLHVYGDINCINMCPIGTVKNDDICTSVCPAGKVLDYFGKECIDKCDTDHPYSVVGVNQCIKECPKGYYYEGDKCVTSCNETNYLINSSLYCKDSCEGEYNFVLNKICYKECPEGFPIFKKIEIGNEKTIRNCLQECGDHLFPGGECKSECDNEEGENKYPYYNYDNGTCLKQCPFFYVESEKKCYKQCPSTLPYYDKASLYHIKCWDSCKSINENYFTNITNHVCQENCEFKTFEDENNVKYCLKDCNDLGLLTYDDRCIKNCLALGENYIFNSETGTCECPNLYYINQDGKKQCLELSKNDCPEEYKYRKNGEKECLSNCKGHILSNDKTICYYDDITTFKCPLVTESVKTFTDTNIAAFICDCPAKFYKEKDANNNERKVCLSEHEECPSNYKYYKPDLNECVPDTDCNADSYCKIDNVNLCLIKVGDCGPFWKKVSEKEYVSVENCDNGQDYYEMEGTNICLQNCQNTTHFIFHDNKCISSCSGIENSELYKIPSSSLGDNPLSLYKCRCVNLWYKDSQDNNKIKCLSPEVESCNIDGKTKKIVDTNECVENCALVFNEGECFDNCDEVKKYYPGFEYIKTEDGSKCRCKGLWIKNDDKIECIKGEICPKEKKFLDNETRECAATQTCNGKIFNNICYKNCEDIDNAENDETDTSTCKCKFKWYVYDNEFLDFKDYKVCLKETDLCPEEYPYSNSNNKCLKSLDECPKVFNNKCVDKCENETKDDPKNEKMCICNTENPNIPEKVRWYQETKKGPATLECWQKDCPTEKLFYDDETKECLVSCPADKFIFENTCYKSCPGKTKVLDQISKICEDILIFDEEEKMETLVDLEKKVDDTIINLYEKKKSVGLVYNIANSTMQFYGVNKNKATNQDLIMRSNLTYIDISKCLDKLYKKYLNPPDADGDIIIVKYDIGDVTNSTTINPVEYKLVNSKTGDLIPMDVCEDNSILISYPLSSILNNFPTRNRKARKLQESDEADVLDLNFREKFLLGKELYLQDNEIDIFNYENKIYNDMCYPLEINGKNLILEDRFNYLYPNFAFCESNCKYNNTDFILERINCYCSPKQEIVLARPFDYLKSEADVEKIKDNQKSTIFKCLSKISNLSKNLGFFYGLIIILIEIGMILLTLLYSYKIFNIRIKRRFDINGDEKYSINDSFDNDTENNEVIEKKVETNDKKKKKKVNNDPIKTTERNLKKNPPKKTVATNDKNDKNKKDTKKKVETDKKGNANDVINIKKTNKNKDFEEKISSSNYPDMLYEKGTMDSIKDMDEESLFSLILSEEKLLRVDYEVALSKNKYEVLVIILTEILDKIYLLKSTWLLQKYEIFSLQFSLYALWHLCMISFLCLFYNNSMLHKIWTRENYPDMGYYLAFGLVVSIIIFVIYKGLTFLINNDIKIKEIEMAPKNNTNEISEKYSKMIKCSKIKLAIYYVLQFGLSIVFFLYLMVYCYLYSSTQTSLIESYLVALIEVVVIKVVYGLILGILRKISLAYEKDKLYTVVRFLDLYIA